MARRRTAGRGSSEQPASASGVSRVPVELEAPGVVDPRGVLAADPVDRAQDVGLDQLRGRAAELVPAAGVDDEERAVGVLLDVGRVEVEVVGGEEVLGRGLEAPALGRQDVAGDLAEVEAGGEEGVARARGRPTRPGPGPHGAAGPRWTSGGRTSGPVRGWPSITSWTLP